MGNNWLSALPYSLKTNFPFLALSVTLLKNLAAFSASSPSANCKTLSLTFSFDNLLTTPLKPSIVLPLPSCFNNSFQPPVAFTDSFLNNFNFTNKSSRNVSLFLFEEGGGVGPVGIAPGKIPPFAINSATLLPAEVPKPLKFGSLETTSKATFIFLFTKSFPSDKILHWS